SGQSTAQPSNPSNSSHPSTPFVPHKDSSLDEPLVSVSINNPFKKILYWLDEIRRKQSTEFDISAKLKIPLIAWMGFFVVLFGTFGLSVNIAQYFQNAQITSILSKYTTKSVT